ncbi:MAG: hypothetical protein NZT92_05270 [Abditibacteriales bacterium]|nr:hypothetical protein [Abditibacteriales bacterium]
MTLMRLLPPAVMASAAKPSPAEGIVSLRAPLPLRFLATTIVMSPTVNH